MLSRFENTLLWIFFYEIWYFYIFRINLSPRYHLGLVLSRDGAATLDPDPHNFTVYWLCLDEQDKGEGMVTLLATYEYWLAADAYSVQTTELASLSQVMIYNIRLGLDKIKPRLSPMY